MTKTISRKSSLKASAAKPLGKPPPRDEIIGLEPDIRFYLIEDGDKTEEVERHTILIIHDESLTADQARPI